MYQLYTNNETWNIIPVPTECKAMSETAEYGRFAHRRTAARSLTKSELQLATCAPMHRCEDQAPPAPPADLVRESTAVHRARRRDAVAVIDD
jgi:hypothetical protein